jgi:hypothetical protein
MRPAKKRDSPKSISVHLTQDGFRVDARGRQEVGIRWTDVKSVTLIKTQQGPWEDDSFYHIAHADGDLTLPQNARKMAQWLTKLKTQPEFDAEAIKRAGQSAETEYFVTIYKASTD